MKALGVGNACLAMLVVLYVSVVNGTLPGFGLPTLGQAIWTTGFAQSFAQSPFLSIFTSNIGGPTPQPIAFGLSAALPIAALLKAGVEAPDAYSSVFLLWLIAAFWGCYRFTRYHGGGRSVAIVGAAVWLTMPVITQHSGYSSLSLGMALLPTYVFTAMSFVDPDGFPIRRFILMVVFSYAAVFMDGYTFVMYAVAFVVYAGIRFLGAESRRKTGMAVRSAATVAAIASAYAVYALYIGKSGFETSSLDFFRGWGADVTFLLAPTRGILWLPDLLGWSVRRSGADYFGDASVFETSFSTVMLATALVSLALPFGNRKAKWIFMLIGLGALYLALGPSFKFNALRPEGASPFMPADYAGGPTGTSFLSLYVPGFDSMRASYRWVGLALAAFWFVVMIALGDRSRSKVAAPLVLAVLLLFNVPHLSALLAEYAEARSDFEDISSDLGAYRKDFHPGEIVAFMPYGNDFLINYAASILGIRTYNIGGDKNVMMARESWPAAMRTSASRRFDATLPDRIYRLLASGDADAVVVPYIDLLWAAHSWPYPAQGEPLRPYVEKLDQSPITSVLETPYWAVVRLEPEYAALSVPERLRRIGTGECLYDTCLVKNRFDAGDPSQTGRFEDGKVSAAGAAGFMAFGPYRPLLRGSYRLKVAGDAPVPAGAHVDVVADKGTTSFGRFPIGTQAAGNSPAILVDEILTLTEDVEDAEVRVWVDEESQVTLTGYSVKPAGDDGR